MIKAFQRYRENQSVVEQLAESERRKNLNYEVAQDRFNRGVCPGCEKKIRTNEAENNFCTDCGLCFFNHCEKCNMRKNALAHYCHHCGTKSPAVALAQ